MKRARRAAANVFPEKIKAERIEPSEAGVALFVEPRGLLSQCCSCVGLNRLIPCPNIAGLACAGALAKPVVERGYVIEPSRSRVSADHSAELVARLAAIVPSSASSFRILWINAATIAPAIGAVT